MRPSDSNNKNEETRFDECGNPKYEDIESNDDSILTLHYIIFDNYFYWRLLLLWLCKAVHVTAIVVPVVIGASILAVWKKSFN